MSQDNPGRDCGDTKQSFVSVDTNLHYDLSLFLQDTRKISSNGTVKFINSDSYVKLKHVLNPLLKWTWHDHFKDYRRMSLFGRIYLLPAVVQKLCCLSVPYCMYNFVRLIVTDADVGSMVKT